MLGTWQWYILLLSPRNRSFALTLRTLQKLEAMWGKTMEDPTEFPETPQLLSDFEQEKTIWFDDDSLLALTSDDDKFENEVLSAYAYRHENKQELSLTSASELFTRVASDTKTLQLFQCTEKVFKLVVSTTTPSGSMADNW